MASKRATRQTAPLSSFLRLERGDDGRRTFWEITQRGAQVITRSGTVSNEGRTTSKVIEDEAQASRLVEKEIKTKRKAGYAEPGPKPVVGSSARKGISLLDDGLNELIEEDPTDLGRYLIYADWLQQHGDPRGELIIVQHALATEPHGRRYDALERAEARLFKDFGADLLGPLARAVNISTSTSSYRGLAWRCGFVRALRVTPFLIPVVPLLEAAREHPALRFLDHLVFDTRTLAVMLATPMPPVRSLYVRVHGPELPLERAFWHTFPGVRALGIERSVTAFAPHEPLVSLTLHQADPTTLANLGNAYFPRLEHLDLTIALPDDTLDASLARLRLAFPALRSLVVRRWEYDHRERPLPQDALAEVILAHADGLALHFEMPLVGPVPSRVVVTKPSDDDDPLSVDRFHHAP